MKPKDNPFRAEKVVTLSFEWPHSGDFALLESQLMAQGGRGLICGPCGMGKTTLLDFLEAHWTEQGHQILRLDFRAHARRAHFPKSDAAGLLLDGLEQLNAWDKLRLHAFSRPFARFVATSHRPGFLPLWWQARTSPQLLLLLCERLDFPIEPAVAHSLFERHNGNLRSCLGTLYHLCAAQKIEISKKTA